MVANRQAVEATRTIFPFLVVIVLVSTFFQRFAFPGFNNVLPVSTVILPVITALACFTARARLQPATAALWVVWLVFGLISLMVNGRSEPVSLSSLLLVAMAQSSLMFRLSGAVPSEDAIRGAYFFVTVMFILSLAGAVQFFAQMAIGQEWAFFMDHKVNPSLLLAGEAYNSLNKLTWQSDLYKSNGLFFVEPSFFGQFIAVAFFVELLTRRRVWCLAGLVLGMFSSFSGTGFALLGIFGSLLAIRTRQFGLLIGGVLALGLASYFFYDTLQLEALTRRSDEFSKEGASGFARFLGIFVMLKEFWSVDLTTILVGKGPGTIYDYIARIGDISHDPTWGKLVFEYGVLGAFAYFSFLFSTRVTPGHPLGLPLLAVYLFMGGYLADGTILSLLVLLITFGPRNWSPGRRRSVQGSSDSRPVSGEISAA